MIRETFWEDTCWAAGYTGEVTQKDLRELRKDARFGWVLVVVLLKRKEKRRKERNEKGKQERGKGEKGQARQEIKGKAQGKEEGKGKWKGTRWKGEDEEEAGERQGESGERNVGRKGRKRHVCFFFSFIVSIYLFQWPNGKAEAGVVLLWEGCPGAVESRLMSAPNHGTLGSHASSLRYPRPSCSGINTGAAPGDSRITAEIKVQGNGRGFLQTVFKCEQCSIGLK